MSHSQNIILYICIQYINIISHILKLEMLYYFEKKLFLQHNVHNKPHVNVSVLPSIAPSSRTLFLYRYFPRLCPSV